MTSCIGYFTSPYFPANLMPFSEWIRYLFFRLWYLFTVLEAGFICWKGADEFYYCLIEAMTTVVLRDDRRQFLCLLAFRVRRFALSLPQVMRWQASEDILFGDMKTVLSPHISKGLPSLSICHTLFIHALSICCHIIVYFHEDFIRYWDAIYFPSLTFLFDTRSSLHFLLSLMLSRYMLYFLWFHRHWIYRYRI